MKPRCPGRKGGRPLFDTFLVSSVWCYGSFLESPSAGLSLSVDAPLILDLGLQVLVGTGNLIKCKLFPVGGGRCGMSQSY